MTSTTFVDKTTLIEAPWLNDVDALVYQGQLDDGTTGAAISQYLPAGTGAVATTVQTKLRESISVKDFGAVGDGVTNDTTAIQTAMDAATSSTPAKTLVFPAGSYLLSSSVSSAAVTPVHWEAQGDVTLICGSDISIAGVPGSLVLATTTVEWQNYIEVSDSTGVAVGDIVFLSANVVTETYRSEAIKRTVARVTSIVGNTINLDANLVFPFNSADSGMAVSYYKPRTVDINGFSFITKTGNTAARAITLTGVADCLGYRNCSFETDSNFNGGLDCEMIQVSVNVNPENCKYASARYGAMRLTTRNCALNGGYAYKVRHLTYPAYWAMEGNWYNLTTESCIAGLDCHSAFSQNCFNSRTVSDVEISNWRCSGAVLENVNISFTDALSAASENGFVMAPQVWATGYTYLYTSFDVITKNVYINYLSGVTPLSNTLVAIRGARKLDLEINSNLTSMTAQVSLSGSNIEQAVVRSDSIFQLPWATTIPTIRAAVDLKNSTGKVDAVYNAARYCIAPYPVGGSTEPGWRTLNTKGRLFSTDVAIATQVLDCRVYDALDAYANSQFTADAVIGVIDFYIFGFSATSTRFDYLHYQWSWVHNMVGSSFATFEPDLRLIESSTGQAGDGMTFAISAPAKSAAPANVNFRNDQYIDFTLTQSWAYSGKLVIDYEVKLTQINQ